MEAKGSSVTATREFVKSNFGQGQYGNWVKSLPEDSAKIYSSSILSTDWYPVKEGLIIPTEKICVMFFNGDMKKGAWETGRFSADYALKGIYRFFVKLGSPEFIVKKASAILPTYYKPSAMSAEMKGKNKASVKVLKFPDISGVIEDRIGGWMEKALEIAGTKAVEINVASSLVRGDEKTEYLIEWE